MVKDSEDGDVNMIDFDIMNGVLKLKWLKYFIDSKHDLSGNGWNRLFTML